MAKSGENTTQIGRSVTIKGELSGSEDLFMDGILEGTVNLAESRLTVGPNSRVKADLKVQDLVVFGVVDGNVQATGRVELRQSAVLHGDVQAARLSIEENATIQGKVELTGSQSATRPAEA